MTRERLVCKGPAGNSLTLPWQVQPVAFPSSKSAYQVVSNKSMMVCQAWTVLDVLFGFSVMACKESSVKQLWPHLVGWTEISLQ